MNTIPAADLGTIEEGFQITATALMEAYEDANDPPELHTATPEVLSESMLRLLGVLRRMDGFPEGARPASEDALETRDISALGNYGLRLLTDLTAWASALRVPQATQALRGLTYALALWLARHEAEITDLQPVVDALALVANRVKSPAALEGLYLAANDITEAVDPALAQDLDHSNPGRPWRLLILNRAIIATRSHQPRLMEPAFQGLVELLPEDAPDFFREGMEQMDALDYPKPVRAVMEKYYQLWCPPKTLH